MSKTITCVGLGEILWDILPSGTRIGGAPANFAYHAQQAGLDSLVVSSVGLDESGDKALKVLSEAGLKVNAHRSHKVTGYVKASLDDKGVAIYDFAEDTAYDNIPMTDELKEIASKTDVCCFGSLAQRYKDGLTRKSVGEFLDAMPQGSMKIFDINLRQSFYDLEVVIAGLKRCTIFKCNEEELPVVCELLGMDKNMSSQEFYKALSEEYGLNGFIYTCGEHGSEIFIKDTYTHVPTPTVQVADTVGAGDSFSATFIALYVQGVSQQEAHETAAQVAAYVCTCSGAMPKLSDDLKAKLSALIDANKPR